MTNGKINWNDVINGGSDGEYILIKNGSNTITNTATGSNLAGDMEVDYFGYDPTNRYDKWLRLDINNAYEKLGS